MDAIELMLGVYHAPRRAHLLRQRELPDRVLDVIQIAAGTVEIAQQVASATGLEESELREAAVLFLQQVLFSDDVDSYRTLGVRPDTDARTIKEHHRWLIHWLHPDRERGDGLSVFADRVNHAWNDLRTPARREAYDAERLQLATTDEVFESPEPGALARINPDRHVAAPVLSGRLVRRLPQIVLGSIAVAGALVLLALYISQRPDDDRRNDHVPPAAASNLKTTSLTSALGSMAPGEFDSNAASGYASGDVTQNLLASGRPSPLRVLEKPEGNKSDIDTYTTWFVNSILSPASQQTGPRSAATVVPFMQPPSPGVPSVSRELSDDTPVQKSRRAGGNVEPIATKTTSQHVATQANGAATMAQDVDVDPRKNAVPAELAQVTIDRMSNAYQRGDLEELMRQFDHSAQSDYLQIAILQEEYRRLFASSRDRSLVLYDLTWLVRDNTISGFGRYDANVIPVKGGPGRLVRGSVRVDLRVGPDGARIIRLSHDDAPSS